MLRIVGFILLVGLIGLGAGWLADRPGDVAVVWQGYRIETSVVVALAAFVATTLALALVWAVIRYVFGLPAALSLSSRTRRHAKGVTSVSRGLVAVGTGDALSARRHAAEAERLLGREPLTLLLKAQAAQMAGDRAGAESAFHLMLDTPETRVLGLRGLFVEARRKGDADAARAYAQKASELAPRVGWASEAVLEYQSADRDWRGALATLDRQTRQKAVGRDTARRVRAVLLTADALARLERDPAEALREAKEAAKLAPGLVPAAVLAGRLLSREGNLRKAAKVLETAWKLSPHPDIAAAYVDLRPGDSARDRHERAEALARLVPHHPEARFIRAATALEIQDFAQARAALAPLLEEYPTVRTCLLMADIAEAEHGTGGEWREWIGRASRARRDPAWIADGVVSETWQPVSPVTGRLDAFEWSAPVERIGDVAGAGQEPASAAPASPAPIAAAGTPEPVSVEAAPAVVVEATPLEEAPAGAYSGIAAAAHPAPVVAEPVESLPAEAVAETVPAVQETAVETVAQEQPVQEQPAVREETVQAEQGVVFPLGHAPDDPGPDAPEEIVAEPVRVTMPERAT